MTIGVGVGGAWCKTRSPRTQEAANKHRNSAMVRDAMATTRMGRRISPQVLDTLPARSATLGGMIRADALVTPPPPTLFEVMFCSGAVAACAAGLHHTWRAGRGVPRGLV